MDYALGDTVKLKKTHPCGSNEWTIIRLGADVKLKCKGCARVVMINYDDFTRQVKEHIKGNVNE